MPSSSFVSNIPGTNRFFIVWRTIVQFYFIFQTDCWWSWSKCRNTRRTNDLCSRRDFVRSWLVLRIIILYPHSLTKSSLSKSIHHSIICISNKSPLFLLSITLPSYIHCYTFISLHPISEIYCSLRLASYP